MGNIHHIGLKVAANVNVAKQRRLPFKNKVFKNPRNPLAIQHDLSPLVNATKRTTPIPVGCTSREGLGAGDVPGLPCQVAEGAQGTEAVGGPGKHLPYLV